jgi:hypothetical protein
MQRAFAIVFGLLLFVAQTFAVQVSASSGAPMAKRSCCGDDCQCCVGQPVSPAAPPLEAAAPAAAHNQSSLLPVGLLSFSLSGPTDISSPVTTATSIRAASVPLFQRNCSFLI